MALPSTVLKSIVIGMAVLPFRNTQTSTDSDSSDSWALYDGILKPMITAVYKEQQRVRNVFELRWCILTTGILNDNTSDCCIELYDDIEFDAGKS